MLLRASKEPDRALNLHGPGMGLEISTGEVSTYVGVKSGDAAQQLAAYAATLIHAASMEADGQHLTSHILLSRGCPGEAACELIPGDIPADKPVFLERSGLDVTAAWSLYPMADSGEPHMEPIMAAIEEAKDTDLNVTSDH